MKIRHLLCLCLVYTVLLVVMGCLSSTPGRRTDSRWVLLQKQYTEEGVYILGQSLALGGGERVSVGEPFELSFTAVVANGNKADIMLDVNPKSCLEKPYIGFHNSADEGLGMSPNPWSSGKHESMRFQKLAPYHGLFDTNNTVCISNSWRLTVVNEVRDPVRVFSARESWVDFDKIPVNTDCMEIHIPLSINYQIPKRRMFRKTELTYGFWVRMQRLGSNLHFRVSGIEGIPDGEPLVIRDVY